MIAALRKTTLSVALLSLGIAMSATAQTGNSAGSTGGSNASSSPSTSMSGGRSGSMSSSASGSNSSVPRADQKFMETAAQDGIAEVQLGQLAAQKAQSDQVKQFGQRMVDDHTKANDQLKQIASTKGVTLPTDTDRSHKREADKLAKLSGADFDRAYMKQMVSEHKKDVKAFQKEAQGGKDPDVKAMASSTVPVLQQHLQMAQSTDQAVRSSKGGAGGSASAASGRSGT